MWDLTARSASLRAIVHSAREALMAGPAAASLAAASTAIQQSLGQVCACSDFVSRSCLGDPQLLIGLLQSGALERSQTAVQFLKDAAIAGLELRSPEDQMAHLRRWRRRELVRIAWRDLA